MSVPAKVNNFSVDFQKLPINMRILSLCLRSLYMKNDVGSSANIATGINKIRDQTRQDAIVYVKGLLPLSTQVVRWIQELFEYYECLELEEWKESLPAILQEVHGYKQCCTEIVRMHKAMVVPLKMRQDEAKVLLSGLKDLNKELMGKKAKLKVDAFNPWTWAFGLCFVPTVGSIAAPLLNKGAEKAKTVADGQQVNINKGAIIVMSETLIPAISAFVDGLLAVAGFFQIMEEELTTFQSKGEKAVEDNKRLHYKMMKKKAGEVERSCKEFYAMIPAVQTDLQCIPEKRADLNYVAKWLTKQQEVIKGKYPLMLNGQLDKLFKKRELTEGMQQLAIE